LAPTSGGTRVTLTGGTFLIDAASAGASSSSSSSSSFACVLGGVVDPVTNVIVGGVAAAVEWMSPSLAVSFSVFVFVSFLVICGAWFARYVLVWRWRRGGC
jgi:hypothetical protein